MRNHERGFVLVTSLILLGILTLAGMTTVYKSLVEIKVSKLSTDLDKANMMANLGLVQLYWYWSSDPTGIAEFDDMKSFISKKEFGLSATAPAVYRPDLTPKSMSDATMPTDQDIIDDANATIRVFTMENGVPTPAYTWMHADAGANPQVAIWTTTFDDVAAPDFPYASPVSLDTYSSCPNDCRFVTYALGRSGDSRSLMRESQSFLDQALGSVAAMTNAPMADDFASICTGATTGTGVDGDTGKGDTWPPSSDNKFGRTMFEVTQAPFQMGIAPSGTALASNTDFGQMDLFGFRKKHAGTTGATFGVEPMLLYTGHGTTAAEQAFKVDYADTTRNTAAVNLPANELPTLLVDSPKMTTDKIEYFANADTNLFSIDTYRWAAEQLTCQDPSNGDGVNGNGNYCNKGELLRRSLVSLGFPAYAPVTGRLSVAQLEYNIANAIPMFGVIRLMVPATRESGPTKSTCNGKTIFNHVIEGQDKSSQFGTDFQNLGAEGSYTGTMPNPNTNASADNSADGPYGYTQANGVTADKDGDLGPRARFIVYGTMVIDYFADYDIATPDTSASGTAYNEIFDPDAGERILTPLESVDVFFRTNIPLIINPVMPRFTGAGASDDPYAFATAAPTAKPAGSLNNLTTAGRINMVTASSSVTKTVNLASPYDGYFPWSEGLLIGPAEMNNAGTMRLMSRDSSIGPNASDLDNPSALGLVKMGKTINTAGTAVASTNTDMTTMLGWTAPQGSNTEADVLEYYYDLTKETVDQDSNNDWPIAPWPGNNLSADFCMGELDCGTDDPNSATWNNNMGDKVHLMFPTGYVHGWKVALAALNINADEWNGILSGTDVPGRVGMADANGLYADLVADCGGSCPAGKPYSTLDPGFADQAAVDAIQSGEDTFFGITKDASTGYGLLDAQWKDIPSTIYSGGLIDIHSHTNMNGIMYTPGPLEWGTGLANYGENWKVVTIDKKGKKKTKTYENFDGLSYVNGSIITGYGMAVNYTSSTENSKYLLVYDLQAVDNAATNNKAFFLRRYDWQRLQ